MLGIGCFSPDFVNIYFFLKFGMIVSRFPFSCRFPVPTGCKICKICHMLSFTFHICVMNFYSHGLVQMQLQELHPINVSKKIVISFAKEQSHLTQVISHKNIDIQYVWSTQKEANLSLCVFNPYFRFRKKILFANIQMK